MRGNSITHEKLGNVANIVAEVKRRTDSDCTLLFNVVEHRRLLRTTEKIQVQVVRAKANSSKYGDIFGTKEFSATQGGVRKMMDWVAEIIVAAPRSAHA